MKVSYPVCSMQCMEHMAMRVDIFQDFDLAEVGAGFNYLRCPHTCIPTGTSVASRGGTGVSNKESLVPLN